MYRSFYFILQGQQSVECKHLNSLQILTLKFMTLMFLIPGIFSTDFLIEFEFGACIKVHNDASGK